MNALGSLRPASESAARYSPAAQPSVRTTSRSTSTPASPSPTAARSSSSASVSLKRIPQSRARQPMVRRPGQRQSGERLQCEQRRKNGDAGRGERRELLVRFGGHIGEGRDLRHHLLPLLRIGVDRCPELRHRLGVAPREFFGDRLRRLRHRHRSEDTHDRRESERYAQRNARPTEQSATRIEEAHESERPREQKTPSALELGKRAPRNGRL
jgi:hypothetical protein